MIGELIVAGALVFIVFLYTLLHSDSKADDRQDEYEWILPERRQ